MTKLKVYISSTYLDMEPLRKQILNKIHTRLPEWFEFTEVMERMRGDGANRPSVDICLANVREADVYILLVGKRYGSRPQTYGDADGNVIQNVEEKSYTWLEYETACESQKKKRRHIYKLEFVNDFFTTERLDEHTDLDNSENKSRFEKFRQAYGLTTPPIRIGSFELMNKEINDLLTRSFLIFNTIAQLNITPEQECSINRHPQFSTLRGINVGEKSAVTSLIINSKNHDEDEAGLLMKRLRNTLRPNETYGNVGNTDWVDLTNVLAGSAGEKEKIHQKILLESWYNITGSKAREVTFETLTSQIDRIENRFLGFVINFSPGDELVSTLIDHFCDFVQCLNDLLNKNEFIYNFFIVLCVNSKEALNEQFVGRHLKLPTESHNLGRLSPVTIDDVKKWFDLVIGEKNDAFKDDFNKKRDDIINHIFVDQNAFPMSYKLCLQDIKSRAK